LPLFVVAVKKAGQPGKAVQAAAGLLHTPAVEILAAN